MISSSDILFGFACSTNELARMDMCSAGPALWSTACVQQFRADGTCSHGMLHMSYTNVREHAAAYPDRVHLTW